MHQISQVENFDGIVRQYSPMVYGTCIRILNDPAKAEDATQETFIKFLESSSQIRKNVGAWLHRVAITQSLTHIRAEKRREKRQNAWATADEATPQPEWKEIQSLIDEAIDELSDELREPLALYFFERKTHREIARGMGVARSTVTYRIQKGVEEIQSRIKSKGVDIAVASLGALLANNIVHKIPETLAHELAKMSIVGNATPTATATATGVTAVLSSITALRTIAALFVVAAVGVTTVALTNRVDPLETTTPTAPSTALTATVAPTLPISVQPATQITATIEQEPQTPPTLQLAAAPADDEEATAQETPDTVLLHGRVFDSESGKNIPNIRVFIRSTSNIQAVDINSIQMNPDMSADTDEHGYFHLDVPPDTSMMLGVGEIPGYVPMGNWAYSEEGIWLDVSRIRIDSKTDSEQYREIAVQEAIGQLRGRILLGGIPAANQEFRLSNIGSVRPNTNTTDANGYFVIDGLPAMEADIGAIISTEDGIHRESPLTWTSVSSSETGYVDFNFAWGELELLGRVIRQVDSEFVPEKNKNVMIIYDDWNESEQKPNREFIRMTTDQNGEYKFTHLPAGKAIVATHVGNGEQRVLVDLPTTDPAAGDIILNSSSITCTVTNPPAGRTVYISVYPGIQDPIEEAKRTGFEATFIRYEQIQLGFTLPGRAFEGLPPGTYTVMAAAWPPSVHSIRTMREMDMDEFKKNFSVAFKTVHVQSYGQKVSVTLTDFQTAE